MYALVASVVLGALLGIFAVFRGEWGWFELRIVMTTIIVAVASMCGLACDQSRTARGLNALPKAGLVLTGASATALLALMWLDISSDLLWRLTIVATAFAGATVHVCLLSIARLAQSFRWVYTIAWQGIFGLAILIAIIVIGELNDPILFRFILALTIADTAITLIIPLLHRVSRSEIFDETITTHTQQRNLAAIDAEIGTLQEQISVLEKLRLEVEGH